MPIAGLVPIAGEIQDVGQLVAGLDANGNQLSTGDRVITGVAAAVPFVSGPMLDGGKETDQRPDQSWSGDHGGGQSWSGENGGRRCG